VSGDAERGARADSPEVRRFLAGHRARRYDLAVQLHGGGGHSNPLVAALGARVAAGGRDRGAPGLDRTVTFRHLQHETLRYLEVVGLVGAPPVTLVPSLAVLESDLNGVRTALPAIRTVDGPLVAVHPGAGDPRRRWPAVRFAAVADALAAEGAAVLVVGGRTDRPLAREMISAGGTPVVDTTGALPLSGLVGLLAGCDLLIGNDSGPRHLAAAVGTPTVGIYWCGNVVNAGALTRARDRVAVSFRTTCPVCGAGQSAGRCPHDESFVAEVGVDEVVDEARDLLGAARAGRSGPATRVGPAAGVADPAAELRRR
jgi:ADP-heptose:LPS heptosyltransferase